ncbi:MAG: hypothetical protein K6L81_16530 [Agarilytica sp.]
MDLDIDTTPLLAEHNTALSETAPHIAIVAPSHRNTQSHATKLSTPNPRQIKQCVRLLRNLSLDIKRQQPQLKTPATWLLKSLVETHYCSADEYDWRITITSTLRNILHATSPAKRHQYRALNTPLNADIHTNKEHTSIGDIYVFAKALLMLLETHNAH